MVSTSILAPHLATEQAQAVPPPATPSSISRPPATDRGGTPALPPGRRRVYVASSWRNPEQPALVSVLRAAGHDVYDFRNPQRFHPGFSPGFSWSEVDEDWPNWGPEQCRDALTHRVARRGFAQDLAGMRWADCCLLLLPCGRSAHLEAGWFAGRGVPVGVVLRGDVEAELMYGLTTHVTTTVREAVNWVSAGCPVGPTALARSDEDDVTASWRAAGERLARVAPAELAKLVQVATQAAEAHEEARDRRERP